VLVLEREKFPRYHIGESLIPFMFQPLQRLGMIPKMKQSHFVKKYSVTFVQPDGARTQPFYFFNRYDRDTLAQTWQVLRSEFDQMMLDNAREKGAEVREETTVNRLLMEDGKVVGAEAADKSRRTYEVRAPHHAGLPGQGGVRVESQWLAAARSLPEQDRGLDLLQGFEARRGYRRRRYDGGLRAGQGLVLAHSAAQPEDQRRRRRGREVPDPRRREGSQGDLSPARFSAYSAVLRQGIENMRKLVYAFYNPGLSFRQVIERSPDAGGQITGCLSGDVNKDYAVL
jgi:hypothetical protein